MSIEVTIVLLYLVSKHGTMHQFERVLEMARTTHGDLIDNLFPAIALETIEWLASQSKLSQLYQYSEAIRENDFPELAGIGFEEVRSSSEDPELRRFADRSIKIVRELETRIGLPDWYADDPTCNRGRYRQLAKDSEYQCFRFISERVEREGTLEIISANRLVEGGFDNAEDWENYLKRLDGQGVINLIEVGPLDKGEQEIFCLYEIPQGMRSLADCLRHENAAGFFTPAAVLDIALAIVEVLIATQKSDFVFNAVDPLNVLWNPFGSPHEIKLLNIGSSLGFPSYQCGVSDCNVTASEPEIGITTASYYLGLLLLQLLKKECPLNLISSTKSKYNRQVSLIDLLRVPNTPPQFRSVLGRMLHRTAEYRYSELKWLLIDLTSIQEFIFSLPDRKYVEEQDNTKWYTLQEFSRFRLKVISRNPEFKALPPVRRAKSMLSALSRDLSYLPEQLLSLWSTKLIWIPPLSSFPKRWRTWKLSPEGKRLLGIAEGWEHSINREDEQPASPLTKLCLYRIVCIEASACLVSFLITADLANSELGEINKHVLKILEVVQDRLEIELELRIAVSRGQPSIDLSLQFTRSDFEQLREFVSWFSSNGQGGYGREATSLKAVALFLVLFGLDAEIFSDGQRVTRSIPLPNLSQRVHGLAIWKLLKYMEDFDREMQRFTELLSVDDTNHESEVPISSSWEHAFDIVDTLHTLNMSRRRAALIHYSQRNYSDGQGIAKLAFPHRGELPFRADNVFLSGKVRTLSEHSRPARVDVSGKHEDRRLSAVLAPSDLFSDLPYPERLLSPKRLADSIRDHKIGFALFTVAIFFILISLVACVIEEVIDTEISHSLRLILSLPFSLASDW